MKPLKESTSNSSFSLSSQIILLLSAGSLRKNKKTQSMIKVQLPEIDRSLNQQRQNKADHFTKCISMIQQEIIINLEKKGPELNNHNKN